MRTKFWQTYFWGKDFAKTSADLFLNSDVANGKGGGLGRNFPFAPLFSFGEIRAELVEIINFCQMIQSTDQYQSQAQIHND